MVRAKRFGAVILVCLFGWTAGAVTHATRALACDTSAAGTTCGPDSLATSTASTLVSGGQVSGTLVSCKTGITTCFNASYTEDVYSDPNNTFCANCLDWLIQLTDNTVPSSDTADFITTITIGSFANFNTDQGTDSNAPPSGSGLSSTGTAIPTNVFRRLNNAPVIGWTFNAQISPGQTTVVLDVMTNATQVVPGQISAQDQSADTEPGLAPANPAVVAEVPATLLLAVVGGAAVGGFLYLRRRQRAVRTAL